MTEIETIDIPEILERGDIMIEIMIREGIEIQNKKSEKIGY